MSFKNKNCLEGFKCPKCGSEEAFIIDTDGIIDGTKVPTQFKARYTDDGFDNPLTVGDTSFSVDGETICDACDHQAPTEDFQFFKYESKSVRESYTDGVCPDCGEEIPDDVPNGEGCSNCGHVFCIETEND